MKIHRSNLLAALGTAIDFQKEKEQKQGFTAKSAYLAGLESLFDAILAGENIEFFD